MTKEKLEQLTEYLIDLVEKQTTDIDHRALIMFELTKLFNQAIDDCILDVIQKNDEWGYVSRTTSTTMKELIKSMVEKKIQ